MQFPMYWWVKIYSKFYVHNIYVQWNATLYSSAVEQEVLEQFFG